MRQTGQGTVSSLSLYGSSKKPVDTERGVVFQTGPEFEKTIMAGFHVMGIDKVMQDTFNSTDPKLLILLKIPIPPKLGAV